MIKKNNLNKKVVIRLCRNKLFTFAIKTDANVNYNAKLKNSVFWVVVKRKKL